MKITRRRRGYVAGLALASLGLAVASTAFASDPDPNLVAARAQLLTLADSIDRVAAIPQLQQVVPLSELNPSGASGLGLGTLLRDALDDLPSSSTGLTQFVEQLEAVAAPGGAPVTYYLGCPTSDPSCATPVVGTPLAGGASGSQLTIPITATRQVTAPFAVETADDSFTLDDGGLTAGLSFNLTLVLELDYTKVLDPATFISVIPPSEGSFSVALSGAAPAFTSTFGFTSVSGSATGTGGYAVPFDLVDPDGSGRTTAGELAAADIADVFDPGTSTSDFDATISLDSDLTGTGTDLTATFDGAGVEPVLTGAGLAAFSKITPDQAIAGIAQLASTFQGVTSAADIRLPLLQEGLASITGAAQPLLDFFAANAVQCGPADPTGDEGPLELVVGMLVFCQALAVRPASQISGISWAGPGGTVVELGTDAGTVSTSPTTRVKYQITNPDTFDPTVTYTVTAPGKPGVVMTAKRAPLTAQALRDKLAPLFPGVPATALLSYDATSRSLLFRLKKVVDPAALDVRVDFGDMLSEAGITGAGDVGGSTVPEAGVLPPGSAKLSVNPGAVTTDVTFGMVLVPDADQINRAGQTSYPAAVPIGEADRFFIKVPAAEPVLSLEDIAATGSFALNARIGFLGLDLATQADQPFQLTKPLAGPALALSVDLPGFSVDTNDDGTDDAPIADAVQLRNLSSVNLVPGATDSDLDTVVNLAASLGLEASASVGGTSLGTATLDVAVPDAKALATAVDPAAVAAAINVTPDGDFGTIFRDFANVGALANDPQQLFSVLVTLLDSLASSIDVLGGPFDEPLPLVGRSPKDLLAQVKQLQQSVRELSGAPSTVVNCGNAYDAVTNALTGDATQPDVNGRVYCRATATKVATGDVVWKALVAGSASPLTPVGPLSPAELVATVGPDPTKVVTFAVGVGNYLAGTPPPTGPGTHNAYSFSLSFADTDGAHQVSLPSDATPTTLQGFVDRLVQRLGLPTGAITASVGSIKKDGADPALRSLVLGLNLGICTFDRDALPPSNADACADSDRVIAQADTPKAPLAFSLGSAGGLASVNSAGDIALSFRAALQVGVAVPLTDNPTPLILDGSKVVLDLGAESTTLSLDANVGPFKASLGTAVGNVPDGAGGTKPAEGILRAGIGFEIGKPGTATNATTVTDFITNLTVEPLAGTADKDCGTVRQSAAGTPEDGTPYEYKPGDSTLDNAFACVRLAASVEGYVGDIGAVFSPGSGVEVAIPTNLLTLLASRILDPAFLLEAFRELVADVAEALKGAGKDVEVPILGDALDAGADVAGTLESAITDLQAALKTIQDTLKPAPANPGDPPPASGYASANAVRDAVKAAVFAALGPDGADILRVDDASDTDGGLSHVNVIARCGSNDPCLDGDTPVSLSDLELRLTLGQGKLGAECTGDCAANLPFDIGLDGLPIRLSGALNASVGWRVHTILGLSRQTGPYLGTNPTVKADGIGPVADELVVDASVKLGDSASNCGPGTTPTGYSTTRCLEGTLGFLQVNVRDGDGPAGPTAKSGVGINASLDISGSGTEPNRLGVQDFLSGAADASFALSGSALLNVSFRTGFREDEDAGFPSVLGKIRVGFPAPLNVSVNSSGVVSSLPTFEAGFSDLQLDIGKFGSQFLNPITEQIKKVTSPLKPVIDTLQAPLPVLTQLAALVGEPPVTLLSLIQAISGQDLRLIQSLLSIIKLANEGLSDTPGIIDLGAFSVDTAKAKSGAVAPNDAGKLVKESSITGLPASLSIPGNSSTSNTPALSSAAEDGRATTFGVKGLDVPFLNKPAEIFKLLMGQDITLISYDAGTLQATAGTSISFGPFFIGPVPVTVFIGGSATVKGRFGLGYDTSGIRKVLDGASGEHLLDGLYLFDHYNGVDLPEITLIGRVFAGAKVDVFIASAGVEGGIELTVDLNLNDSPTNDGKLYIEELIARLQNPICLFDVSGALDAFLNFFLEINLFITSKKFTFEIIRVRLLDFSSSCSNTPDPVLGTYEGPDGDRTLNLTVGTNASNRDFMEEEKNEKYIVRQTGPDSVDVTAFGFTKPYGPIKRIRASAGDGNDVIQLLPGGTAGTEAAPSQEIPFLLPADLRGGPGKDKLIGGNGPNRLYGSEDADVIPGDAPDDDTLTGGSASDRIFGGRGSDAIEGGPANDILYGDSSTAISAADGADRINGGGGADKVNAGPGDDAVAGGPGLVVAGTPTAVQVPLVDGGDTIIGGNGSDTLSGVSGDDVIYGGVPAGVDNANPNSPTYRSQATIDDTCANEPAVDEAQSDQITGGDGNDTLLGGPGRDEITGDGGSDRLCGLTGRDGLDGDGPKGVTPKPTTPDGKDTVEGGSQNDRITGGGDNDYLTGSAGNDRVLGGPGQDDVLGDVGRDHLEGGDDNDIVIGDTSTITELNAAGIEHTGTGTQLAAKVTQASSDEPTTGPAQCVAALTGAEDGFQPVLGGLLGDCLIGGSGNDALFGDGGSDRILGEAGFDHVDGGNQADLLFGGLDADVMYGRAGKDDMQGDSGNDEMYGGTEDDVARGGPDNDLVYGQQDDDDLFGDGGFDRLIGGDALDGTPDGTDDIVGGTGNDVILGDNGTLATPSGNATMPASSPAGTFGNDVITGDTGDDRIYGQLGNDTISGNAGFDHVFGDMGGLVLSDPLVTEPGGGTRYTATLFAPDAGGIDTIRGGTQDDVVYGGAADDVISGNAGDDHLEGNGGKDTIHGLSAGTPSSEDLNAIALTVGQAVSNLRYTSGDDDDIIGGSSSVHPLPARADDGETEVHGNLGSDVILGDNGEINRLVDGSYWAYDPIFIGPKRTTDVTFDEGKTGLDLDTVSGADTLHGDELNDVILGQGEDDLVFGEDGDDLLVGNEDQDVVRGQDGEDDVIGGSLVATQTDAGVGSTDGLDDTLFGDAGNDVIAGDNAAVTRDALSGTGLWAPDALNGGHLRTVVLHNTRTGPAERFATSGNDVISGGTDNDLAFGEGSDDAIHGDAGHDRLLGNQDADTIDGDGGQDDLTGGSAIDSEFDSGDILRGGTEQDVEVGDNAVITRVAAGDGSWLPDVVFGGSKRTVTLLDTEKRGADLTQYAGEDLILGGPEQDRLFGQADNDTVKGNDATDFVQGNQDSDLLEGNHGDDLLIGGSEVAGQPDGDDTIHGGGEADVAIGDNGLVDRPAAASPPTGGYYYETYQLGVQKTFVKLWDIDVNDATLSGSDIYSGGQGVDVGFGQGERDYLLGGSEDDYLEGNGGSDFLWGDETKADIVENPSPQLPLLPNPPGDPAPALPPLPAGLPEGESSNVDPTYELSGLAGPDGQDDQIGGSSKESLLDEGDFLYGNGAADFQLGDNGKLQRTFNADLTAYTTYTLYNALTVQRRADRWNVGGDPSLNGPDYVEGNDGDDYQWGQEDGDELYGNAGNDDMYGELGKDTMFGGAGEDAMLGDRGGIVDTKLTAAGAAAKKTTQGPTFFDYQGLWKDQLDRRVDLFRDHTTAGTGPMSFNGHDTGDTDYMRGGSGHDSMHGGFGDDLMNGDSGGDYLFGADGRDVMWGGVGKFDEAYSNTAPSRHLTDAGHPDFAQGIGKDNLVDILFGGLSGRTEGVADVMDYRPRPQSGTNGCATAGTEFSDPCSWFDMTGLRPMTSTAAGTPLLGTEEQQPNQHHQGIDWQYGGQGRDVMQGDVGKNGPDSGDRLLDWVGTFNLYTRCNASYGDDGDVRQHSPDTQSFMQTLAWGSGVGASTAAVNQSSTSAYRELSFVFAGDKNNNGKAFATTPGHYDQPSCVE